MTDREKAIVMAYTGVTMLTGDKCQIFDKYVEEIMGRPIWMNETQLADKIKEKSKADFLALCDDENSSENLNKWIPTSERLPKTGEYIGDVAKHYLVQTEYGDMMVARFTHSENWERIYQLNPIGDEIVAWRELPEPYVPDINVGSKNCILDKIKAEIEAKCCITVGRKNDCAITLHDVFEIIDKYKAEREE